jgi:hypothetical protein
MIAKPTVIEGKSIRLGPDPLWGRSAREFAAQLFADDSERKKRALSKWQSLSPGNPRKNMQ